MKKSFQVIRILLAFVMLVSGALFAETHGEYTKADKDKPMSEGMKIIKQMKYKPLQVKVPKVGKEIERVVLPNGMILYMLEDHSLPQVNIHGVIRTGSVYENKNQNGLAEVTGRMIRQGGTTTRAPKALDEELDYIAATVETSMAADSGGLYMNCISRQTDKALEIMADVLRNPGFDQKELDLVKSQVKEKLRRKNDQVDDIGDRLFYSTVFGDHPSGWEPDWNVIKNIKREDLIAWHQKYYKPNNMMFAIVGDFKKSEMIDKFNKLFGNWEKGDVDFSSLKEIKYEFHPGVFIARKDVNQSYVRVGHLGVKRDNPDIYAIKMMNHILGGGSFGSLMVEKIRSDEGLAYSVFSYYNTESRDYGTSGALCQTKSKSTMRALELMRLLIAKMQTEKVTPQKLQWAKDTYINGFVFEFSKPSQQVQKLMLLEYNHMPSDFYEKYLNNIRKVTVDDVQNAAKKYLHPDKLSIVLVGNPAEFEKPLESLKMDIKEIKLEDFVE
ncbi:MAG: insulinase family protein [Firmicutes bacterium]|nr:insulinase family protein [Bacillota bacterium]